jgi:Flp pilus assembly pilin Flp
MRVHMKKFLASESGAVTVDWVVLTAAIVGLGVAVVSTVANGALDHSTGLGNHMGTRAVTTTY